MDFLFQHPGQEIPPHALPPGQWRLTTSAGAGGSISRDPDLAQYTNGATVTVGAVANPGFAFTGWSGDASGTNNPIAITMKGHKTVTASFREVPARVLAVVNPEARREGRTITFPIELTSQGEVGGMTFILRYNPDYLGEPELAWAPVFDSALNQVNVQTPGVVRATFALPATAVPAGRKTVATVSFRARSVPFSLNTDLILQILDVSRPTGDPITSGSVAQSGQARILLRRVAGDNNGNSRLDIGDATIIQRLLTGFREVRPWDVTGNDLNANRSLDSGDVVKVLRVVADLDPQPTAQSGPGAADVSRPALRPAGPASESVEIVLDKSRAPPGDIVTVQVRLQGILTGVAGGSFRLDYPVNALRLLNSQSRRTGALVPAGAVAVWNVAPAQNNYPLQTGRVSAGFSSPRAWPANNGVLAEFTFQVQAGQTAQHCWPVRVSGLEITENGYEVRAVPDAQTCFIGRDPVPPRLNPAGIFLTSQGASFSLNVEIGMPCTIEVSTDLLHWLPLTTLDATSGTLTVIDPYARNSAQRFYRAKQ